MTAYFQYFFEHGGQVVALASVGLVWLGFTALGAATGGPSRMRAFDPLVGWGWLGLAFTTAGVLTPIGFSYLAAAAALLAAIAAAVVWRREGALLPRDFLKLVALAVPLLVLVSAMQGSQWDEMSDWLVIPRYLLASDHFAGQDNPYQNAVFTGYPYGWHYVTYLASRVAGRLLENAGSLFNVLLLLTYGVVVLRLIATGLGREDEQAPGGWTLVAIAGLAVTLVNPTFAQKIVLTAYAEVASAVATGAAVLLGWRIVESLAADRPAEARTCAWQMGAVLALLINLKQATLVLVVLAFLATTFVMLRERRVAKIDFVRLLPAILGPAVAVYLVWRYYVTTETGIVELKLTPFSEWLIALVPDILWRMLVVLSKKGYYLALVVLVVAFGIRGFIRSATPFDRLAAIGAMVVLGYNAFLLLTYVAMFGEFDALRVASYWRYNMHLGPIVIAVAAYGAAMIWQQRLADKWSWQRLRWVPVILMLAAPFVFAKKLRFDKTPTIVHFRSIGQDVAKTIKPGDSYAVVDPTGSGESGIIMAFEIGDRAKRGNYISAFHNDRLKFFQSFVDNQRLNVMVVFSINDGFGAAVGHDLQPNRTYLLRRGEDKAWAIVKDWPQPAKG